MKKKGIILMAVLLVVFVGLAIAVKSADSSTKMDKKNLTVVTAPDQKEAQENEQFTVPEYKSAEVKGENVALKQVQTDTQMFTHLFTQMMVIEIQHHIGKVQEKVMTKSQLI